tara:strand:- start:233 stop:724 length:492 start_codon:yes stop_codon:yes gene_type:complete
MGWWSDLNKNSRQAFVTGFISAIPGGTAYVLYNSLGEVEVVNADTPEAQDALEFLTEQSAEQAKDALGVPDLEPQTLAEKFGEAVIQGVIRGATIVAGATIDLIENVGPAVIDGAEKSYNYLREKIRGYEVYAVEAITVGLIAVLTGVYLWNAAKRGTMIFTE